MLLTPDFCELYDMKEDAISQQFYNKNPLIHKDPFNRLWIDDKKFMKRWNFRRKIWNRSHDNYYKINEHINDSKLAEILSRFSTSSKSSWIVFLTSTLFIVPDEQLSFKYQIPKRHWDFYRITTAIIRHSERTF